MLGYKIAGYYDTTEREWKPCMVFLEIPEGALVVRPLTVDGTHNKKLRCDKAKVVSICDLEDRSIQLGFAVSLYVLVQCIRTAMPYYTFVHRTQPSISPRCIMDDACTVPGGIYKPGEIVEPHDFSTANDQECAPGIHFFITEEDAMDFYTSPRILETGSWSKEVISDANKYTAL